MMDDLRRWIGTAWDPELSLREWRTRLADAGWACPGWPVAWGGRGLSAAAAEAVGETLAQAGVPGPPDGVGMHLAAPTILEHGPDALRRRFLRPTVTGEIGWCQLFSEPGAGSDLAGLTARAECDGEGWVVSGQKVWNTGAAQADFGLLLARTDWDAPKHRGITYFVLPMRQPGVDVRPLRQMNGHASFNEVFLDRARVPADFVIGAPSEGWQAALTTLAHERRLAPSRRLVPTGRLAGRAWREAIAERIAASEPHTWYPQRAGRPDLVIAQAVAAGMAHDPLVRQEIAKLIGLAWSAKWMAQRAAAARALGRPPGPESSLGKPGEQCDRAGRGARPRARRRGVGHAGRIRRAARRHHRRDLSLGAGDLDRRRHGRDPAQHHRGARPRTAERAGDRSRRSVPPGTEEHMILDRDGVALHCPAHDAANGRLPLLLPHGYSASSAMWRPNLSALTADRLARPVST